MNYELRIKDKGYPRLLREVKGAPRVLYIKGEFEEEDSRAIAVVGTRQSTSYGERVTKELVFKLVKKGFTIVSGLAYGIDTVAHKAALDAGGRTIAVLGTGIDKVYPRENLRLAERIVNSGVLMSELGPGKPAVKGSFPARNRIISGLSLGVLVVEGKSKSGTKITASHALDQGREVFAIPGAITSAMSQAPNDLIKLGAKVTTGIEDILEELPDYKATP